MTVAPIWKHQELVKAISVPPLVNYRVVGQSIGAAVMIPRTAPSSNPEEMSVAMAPPAGAESER